MASAASRSALALALLLGAPHAADACSVCSRGDPLAPAAEGHGRGGDLRVALDAEALSQRSGTPGEGASMHDVLDQYGFKVTVAYSPVPEVNLVASAPWLHKTMTMDHGGGVLIPVGAPTEGLGDVEVGARWFFWESANMHARMRQGLALSAGSSLPTGANDARFASDGTLLAGISNPQHVQLGAGAFGPYAGLSYRLQRDPWAALLSVSGRTHGTSDQGYRYGGALLWTAQAQWTPASWLALGLGLDGHHGAQDTLKGAPVVNTGGSVIWASPSVFANLHGRLWMTLRAQVPVHADLVGEQSVSPVALAGLQYVVF